VEPPPLNTLPGIKWNPGHYLLLYLNHSKDQLNDVRNEQHVQGVQIRYEWRNLEPRRGEYDFSEIEADLRTLASMPTPKRLVIQILDRQFHTTDRYKAAPRYIVDTPSLGVSRTKNGYVANIWRPAVMDRKIALYRALAARFDHEPYFEAISNSESAPGFGTTTPPSHYSRQAMAAQTKRLMTEAQAAFQQTNVILFANSLVGELDGLLDHCVNSRCALGGPDVKPARPTQAAQYITRNRLNRGTVPIMFSVQSPNLGPEAHRNTPQEIYDYAMRDLGATHLFWIRFGSSRDTGSQKFSWREGILPVIRANQGRTRSDCPQTYEGRCNR